MLDSYPDRMTGGQKPEGAFWAPAVGSRMFESFCRKFFASYCPLTVEGRHHLPDKPFLLCSNHSSHIDSAALMTASGRGFSSFALLGASDYFFHSRRVRWSVAPLMNVIPIERRPGPKSLTACLTICRRFLEQTGGALILYPEGTRSRDGEMQAFKTGAGLFAIELGVPLVPAHIEGTHRILPKGQSVPRSGPLTVRFGKAIELAMLPWDGESIRDQRRFAVEKLARNIRLLSFGCQTREFAAEVEGKG
jgi:1-acyl-sn-glycerol-3-phosphate acyltransferase/long-chain acyl-CoA synthetase